MKKFISFIQKALATDQRLRVEAVNFGSDVLLQQAKEKPDLLIIDDDLTDIPGSEVIKSLRRTELPGGSKILCGMKSQRSNRGLKRGPTIPFGGKMEPRG